MRSVHGGSNGSYVYSCGVDATSLLGAGLHYLRERGLTRIAVITSTDATGQDADRAIAVRVGGQHQRGLKAGVDCHRGLLSTIGHYPG